MPELKFIKIDTEKERPACCGQIAPNEVLCEASLLPEQERERPAWVIGTIMTEAGAVPVVSTDLTKADYWEHVKCRTSAFRNSYIVPPGLYAVGRPDKNSDILVSANYKLSFDVLRRSLTGLSAWLLVLNTKGINVWCAAGKGTFGTDELIRRINMARLDRIVGHSRIIVPQLGAAGISAHKVKSASGFRVHYGPVRAGDIGAYIAAGYQATREMRTVEFPLIDRLVLTPMEINPAIKKYYPWYALIMLAIFGLQPGGIFFKEAVAGGLPFLLMGLLSVLTGALVTPVLLPFIPFRSFAVKGWITGMLSVILSTKVISMTGHFNAPLLAFTYLFFPLVSSYIALQFTGSTTFTGMSGVKKELRISIPLYIVGIAASLVLLTIYKMGEWRLI
ncbi:MAG TPA: acetyl-CoA synthase subunit gamma [Nitrospiraceae bacterium]|jgi:hypothetical protein|nr:acetyl-CoA synthase subunit gamma [Nitrospiraceae bacterium]